MSKSIPRKCNIACVYTSKCNNVTYNRFILLLYFSSITSPFNSRGNIIIEQGIEQRLPVVFRKESCCDLLCSSFTTNMLRQPVPSVHLQPSTMSLSLSLFSSLTRLYNPPLMRVFHSTEGIICSMHRASFAFPLCQFLFTSHLATISPYLELI